MALEAMGYQAISFTGGQIRMMTDGVYSKAQIKSIDAEFIRRELGEDRVVIVAGFQGIDEYGNITTLGRGGSDTSAVALAAALKAEECEIFTDVDGVYTADPRVFKNAVMLDEISYDEMLEMASLGAGVMHIRSVAFGKRYNVKIRVRNSENDNPGTIITHEVPQMEGVLVSGATIQKDMAKISLIGMPNVPGHGREGIHPAGGSQSGGQRHHPDRSQPREGEHRLHGGDVGPPDRQRGRGGPPERTPLRRLSLCGMTLPWSPRSASACGRSTAWPRRCSPPWRKAKVNIDSITTSEIRISCAVGKDQVERALEAVCLAFELDKPARQRKPVG